jgi:hypothetical protein
LVTTLFCDQPPPHDGTVCAVVLALAQTFVPLAAFFMAVETSEDSANSHPTPLLMQ